MTSVPVPPRPRTRVMTPEERLRQFIGHVRLADLDVMVARHDGEVVVRCAPLEGGWSRWSTGSAPTVKNTGILPKEINYLARILCPPRTKASAAFEGSGDWPEGTLLGNISLDPLLQICGFLDNRALLAFQLVCKTWRNFFVSNEQQVSHPPMIVE
ncbi:hypothetical protein Pelo_17588 [Pelomyxa schiedti]|nr:hypothetical protein Pelo_17588 [Pelomyxa schiedti]